MYSVTSEEWVETVRKRLTAFLDSGTA